MFYKLKFENEKFSLFLINKKFITKLTILKLCYRRSKSEEPGGPTARFKLETPKPIYILKGHGKANWKVKRLIWSKASMRS